MRSRHGSTGAVLVASVLAGALVVISPSLALAHPLVDEGHALVEQARFAEALERFDRAAQGDDLRREDVVRLLEGRALALHALGDDAAMTEHLVMLASLDPTHVFPEHVPPEVIWRFRVLGERGAGRLRVRVGATTRGDTVTLTARLEGDPGGLVRGVSLSARAVGDEWHGATDGDLSIEVGAAREVEYHVTVTGLGGAALIEQGSAAAPLPLFVLAPVAPAPAVATPARPEGTVEAWPFVVGGVAVLAAVGAVVATVLVTMPDSDRTAPTGPVLALTAPLGGSP